MLLRNSNPCNMTVAYKLNWKLTLQPFSTVAMVKMLPVLSLNLWMALCGRLLSLPPHLLSESHGLCHRSCVCKHENPIYSVIGIIWHLPFSLLLWNCLQSPQSVNRTGSPSSPNFSDPWLPAMAQPSSRREIIAPFCCQHPLQIVSFHK